MAFPKTGTERARSDIAETFEEFDFSANEAKLVGQRVLPVREVQYAHGTYPAITLKDLMRGVLSETNTAAGHALRRTPLGGYVRDELPFVQRSYSTNEHGMEGKVDENEAAHYASELEHEVVTAARIRHQLLLQYEERVAAGCTDTTFFTDQNGAPATVWSDHTNADPITDVFLKRHIIRGKYGIMPDTLVMNELAWEHLKQCDVIVQKIEAQGAGQRAAMRDITTSQVAQILDVDEIIVGAAVKDGNGPNASTFQGDYIWPDDALLFKRIRGRDFREIGLGHTLHWSADGSMPNGIVEDYYLPEVRSNIMRVRHQTGELFKYALGYLFTTVYS